MHCRTLSSFSGLCPLDASSSLPSIMTPKKSSHVAPVPGIGPDGELALWRGGAAPLHWRQPGSTRVREAACSEGQQGFGESQHSAGEVAAGKASSGHSGGGP